MVVGHNPGLAELALGLCMPPLSVEQEERHRRMRDKFATSSLAVIGFDLAAWRSLRPGSGMLEDFMRPRDLGQTGE
jgi:phosphohistidine phosphatase SixA